MYRPARRQVLLIFALCFDAAASAAAELGPADFAFGQRIEPTGSAAAYRLTLPLPVYQQSVHADLRDLRVFNARNEVVPYAVMPRSPGVASAAQSVSRPLFAVTDTTPSGVEALRLAIDAPGASTSVQARLSAHPSTVTGSYLVDLRGLPGPVGAMRLGWVPGTADFAGRVSLDAGDSLDSLRPIAAAAVLANLHAGGESLVEDRIEFPATGANFARVSWIGKPPPVTLATAVLEVVAGTAVVPRLTFVAAGQASGERPGSYDFDLGGHMPVDRLQLELPEPNSILQADYLARDDAGASWRRAASGGAYRLADGSGEIVSGPLAVPTTTARYWRVQNRSPTAPLRGTPKLAVQWIPADLVFLAHGPGPYLLAYGSAVAPAAESSLATLPSSVVPAPASLAGVEILGGPGRQVLPGLAAATRRSVLWSVLGVAVLLLGAMAYMLLREVKGSGRS